MVGARMVGYTEAGEDFVKLLFTFLTLPLGFIITLWKDALISCTRVLRILMSNT